MICLEFEDAKQHVSQLEVTADMEPTSSCEPWTLEQRVRSGVLNPAPLEPRVRKGIPTSHISVTADNPNHRTATSCTPTKRHTDGKKCPQPGPPRQGGYLLRVGLLPPRTRSSKTQEVGEKHAPRCRKARRRRRMKMRQRAARGVSWLAVRRSRGGRLSRLSMTFATEHKPFHMTRDGGVHQLKRGGCTASGGHATRQNVCARGSARVQWL